MKRPFYAVYRFFSCHSVALLTREIGILGLIVGGMKRRRVVLSPVNIRAHRDSKPKLPKDPN